MGVELFDTVEEAMERTDEALKAADARVVYWQTHVKQGDCVMCDSGGGFAMFCEVLETYTDERLQHFRFSRCYSVACPEGELGDVHVSTFVCKLSRGAFERLRKQGWQF